MEVSLFMRDRIIKVYDSKKEMYIAEGSTILFPKYTDFLCEAKQIKSSFELWFYKKFNNRYTLYSYYGD